MEEEAELRPIIDTIEKLNLYPSSLMEKMKKLVEETNTRRPLSRIKLIHSLEMEEDKDLVTQLLDQIDKKRENLLLFANVLSLKICDLLACFERDIELGLKVIEFFRLYYGPYHPRVAVKLYTTALIAKGSPTVKQRLLIGAQDIAQVTGKCSIRKILFFIFIIPFLGYNTESGSTNTRVCEVKQE